MFPVYSVTHVPGLYPALHSVGLLNVPYSTFAGGDPQAGAPARGAAHSGWPFRHFVTSRCEKCGPVIGIPSVSHRLAAEVSKPPTRPAIPARTSAASCRQRSSLVAPPGPSGVAVSTQIAGAKNTSIPLR